MYDAERSRAEDERAYQAYRAALSGPARADLDAAQTLMQGIGRSLTQAATGAIVDCTWLLHAVRHRLGATDPEAWCRALLELAQRHPEAVLVSLYALLGDGEEGLATWEPWHDQLVETWADRHVTNHGVLTLAATYGLTVPPAMPPWYCEECVCLCGRQTERPLGGFCVLCRLEYDL